MANLGMRSAVADLKMRVADELWVAGVGPAADPVGGGKAAALAALRKLDPEQVRPALRDALKSASTQVRKWCRPSWTDARRRPLPARARRRPAVF